MSGAAPDGSETAAGFSCASPSSSRGITHGVFALSDGMSREYSDLVEHLQHTSTVTIVTSRQDGEVVATPIWAVIVDGTPYARAAFGAGTAWFRRAVSGRATAVSLADGAVAERDPVAALEDPRVPVRVSRVAAEDAVQDAVTAAYEAKYLPLAPAHVPSTTNADAVARTIALLPA